MWLNKSILDGDLFDITSRIKEIDSGYFVVHDNKYRRYEVHSRSQKGNTFCFVVSYDRLDARVLEMARKTRVERLDKLLKEAEKSNEQMIKDENEKLKRDAHQRFDEIMCNN